MSDPTVADLTRGVRQPSPSPAEGMGVLPPILPYPTGRIAAAMGRDGFEAFVTRREWLIRMAKADPLHFGWEPPAWMVADCLLGLPWVDAELAERVRTRLGFARSVDILLVNGSNRGGKSEYGARTASRMLHHKAKARVYCFHQSERDSKEQQQPLMHKYLPPGLRPGGRKAIKTASTYVSYTIQNGFSEGFFVLPNESTCGFRNYGQDPQTHEGLEPDLIWCDELAGSELVETLRGRLATRGGKLIVTFTPITGYTPTVRVFYQSMLAMRHAEAFLLPADGGAPEVDAAMWVEQFEDLLERPAPVVERPRPAPGRTFEKVPRVAKCHDDKAAVMWFHGSDNPFGNPRNTFDLWKGATTENKRIRLYGLAEKAATNRFPKFSAKIHVVPAGMVPKDGTNYHIIDPASARNFFMLWFRCTKEGVYVYREWPGPYEIPGIGVPGPWTENDGKKLDGKRGPAQKPFGWGLERYKREIARLEGWKDAQLAAGDKPRPVKEWKERAEDAERIRIRFIDSRAASAPRVENDRRMTLLTDFEEMNMGMELTPGDDVEEGVQAINTLLDYDSERFVDFFNRPRLYVADCCPNTIYSLENWTGEDGQKGACRDPIDVLRYFARLDVGYVGEAGLGGTAWGSY